MDVVFVGMAAEDEFQLGGGDHFADDALDVVADDAFGGGEVADAHADDPALVVGDLTGAPLFDVFLHADVFGLPVVGLHVPVNVVGPLVFEGEEIKGGRFAAVDDAFALEGGFSFGAVEDEGFVADGERNFHDFRELCG